MEQYLRPIERRVLAMRDAGMDVEEIARRIKRSPAHVERMITWTKIPRTRPAQRRSPLAMERRVLHLRAQGESHEQIAERFRRGAPFIQRVEGLAHYKLALDLLT